MSPETLKALKASIEKWKRNAVAETPDSYPISVYDCPLCTLFYKESLGDRDTSCIGCPVREKTRHRYCNRSPYVEASRAWGKWVHAYEDETLKAAAHEAARAEVAFLESLLPEGEKP